MTALPDARRMPRKSAKPTAAGAGSRSASGDGTAFAVVCHELSVKQQSTGLSRYSIEVYGGCLGLVCILEHVAWSSKHSWKGLWS